MNEQESKSLVEKYRTEISIVCAAVHNLGITEVEYEMALMAFRKRVILATVERQEYDTDDGHVDAISFNSCNGTDFEEWQALTAALRVEFRSDPDAYRYVGSWYSYAGLFAETLLLLKANRGKATGFRMTDDNYLRMGDGLEGL
jgi:hypothetical protein